MTEQQTQFEPEVHDPMEDTGLANKGTVRRRKKTADIAAKELDATAAGIMENEYGRRWFWWLLGLCHCNNQPLAIVEKSGHVDPYRTVFNAGEMNVGNQVSAMLQRSCPELFLKMIREANEKELLNA